MKPKECINEQDLILCHYGELDTSSASVTHLASCDSCQNRLAALKRDLERLPHPDITIDPAATTRMAARVKERLYVRRPVWPSVFGGALTAAVALVITIMVWSPADETPIHVARVETSPEFNLSAEDLPDMEFLDNLELLENFELLQQLEGV